MSKIIQLSSHVANLIAAGEVVERPASAVKELLENAVDAGATKVTVEIQDGGMTFLRITDNGCGMSAEDAQMAFKRHATSKLRTADDLAAIGTMGFRGEALAAIASVSRIDLMTKTPGAIAGTSLHLEAGEIQDISEVGCPDGTTIIIRDLFYNTPARMKFMKSDTVEGSRVAGTVQMQALAHPEVAISLVRDGKQTLSTPGTGKLRDAVYCVYGRECANMASVDSSWEKYHLSGFVSKPTDARPSRNLQTFFVNGRPVKSKMLVSALEEAYRNQIMVGKFPSCVLHLQMPANAVDVNVHPAKTEVKFLNEKAVFDCVHYGVLAALNQTPDRPNLQFKEAPSPLPSAPAKAVRPEPPSLSEKPALPERKDAAPQKSQPIQPKKDFFQTMSAQEFQAFAKAMDSGPKPKAASASKTVEKIRQETVLHQDILLSKGYDAKPIQSVIAQVVYPQPEETPKTAVPALPEFPQEKVAAKATEMTTEAMESTQSTPWRMVGELYKSYIIVEQGEDAFLIDKHAAHERILFDKLKNKQEAISAQTLLTPIPVKLSPAAAGILLSRREMLADLGFEIEEFGDNTVLLRQIPMDLSPEDAAEAAEAMADDLLSGKTAQADTVRDEILHTVACKAAIKAGWNTSEKELLALVTQVMVREDLKYCPHGRPICISLSKKQLEKQFKRA